MTRLRIFDGTMPNARGLRIQRAVQCWIPRLSGSFVVTWRVGNALRWSGLFYRVQSGPKRMRLHFGWTV